jgi:hypothetical protein
MIQDNNSFFQLKSNSPRDSMGIAISPNKKREYLEFIRPNLGKISQREIARRLGIGKTTVNCWAKKLGFKHQKHTVNKKFFDKLTEKSAYILGFIYADGNIAWNPKKGYQSLTITASAKDKEHLEKIRNLLLSSKPLLYSPKTNSYRLIVNNKNLCNRLMTLGVFPRKSLIVQFPDFLPDEYLKHFLRGVIDGDGSVYYCDRKRSPYFVIKIFSGSEEFLQELVKKVKEVFDIDGNVRKNKKNLYRVEYSCSRGKKLAKHIYSNSSIFLKRKYLPYKKNVLGGTKNE